MNKQIGVNSQVRCDIGLAVKEFGVKILGELREVDRYGNVLKVIPNTVTTAFKNASAKGAATGTFSAVNKAELTESGAGTYLVNTSKIAGGTQGEDYVTFEFEWQNTTGSQKTITAIDMGYDLQGGGEVIYFQVTGLSKVVENNETVKWQWKITVAYGAGGIALQYRYELAAMIASGLFGVPAKISFHETGGTPVHNETATLESGGTGSEAWHQWEATHTAGGTYDIDIIRLWSSPGSPDGKMYTDDDITDKSLISTETLTVHIKIDHS